MSTTSTREVLSVTAAAEARRSIRKYEPTPIPRADLEEILRVTQLAPSPWNVQPWRYVIVEDQATKLKLQEAAYGQPQVASAPAVIVMYSDMTDALATIEEVVHPGMGPEAGAKMAADVRGMLGGLPDKGAAWGNAESNIALGYLLLTAQAHGYSTSPMLGFNPEAVKTLLGLPADSTLPAIVAIGIGAEEGFPHHRHPVSRVARFV